MIVSQKWELGVCTQSLVVLAAAPLLLAGMRAHPTRPTWPQQLYSLLHAPPFSGWSNLPKMEIFSAQERWCLMEPSLLGAQSSPIGPPRCLFEAFLPKPLLSSFSLCEGRQKHLLTFLSTFGPWCILTFLQTELNLSLDGNFWGWTVCFRRSSSTSRDGSGRTGRRARCPPWGWTSTWASYQMWRKSWRKSFLSTISTRISSITTSGPTDTSFVNSWLF